MAPSNPPTRRRQGGGASAESTAGVSGASPVAVGGSAAAAISEGRQRSIRAHADTLGEPVDPGLLALLTPAAATPANKVTPGSRRSKRDR